MHILYAITSNEKRGHNFERGGIIWEGMEQENGKKKQKTKTSKQGIILKKLDYKV